MKAYITSKQPASQWKWRRYTVTAHPRKSKRYTVGVYTNPILAALIAAKVEAQSN